MFAYYLHAKISQNVAQMDLTVNWDMANLSWHM